MAFEPVTTLDELDDSEPARVEVDGHPICLVKVGQEVRAIYDVCSHQEYPLHEGYVFDTSIECALHGSTFDLATGQPEALPATKPVPVYATKIDGDDVLIDMDQQLNDAPVPKH